MITRIYIGSNNLTKKLELDKIELIVNQYHDGFTIIKACGYWNGKKENTAIIEICDKLVSEDLLVELKSELKQDSLLVSRMVSDTVFY